MTVPIANESNITFNQNNSPSSSEAESNIFNDIKIPIIKCLTVLMKEREHSKIKKHIDKLKESNTLDLFIANLNHYLSVNIKGKKCTAFLKEIKNNKEFKINKNYELNAMNQYKEKQAKEKLSIEGNDDVRNNELCLKEQERIEHINNDIKELVERCIIFRGLVEVHCRIFECKMFSGSDRIVNRFNILNDEPLVLDDLSELKKHFEKLNELKRDFITDVDCNIKLLLRFHENSASGRCEIIPDAAQMISTMLEKISNQDKTIWIKMVDAIASFLFTKSFESRASDKIELAINLINLKELITNLRGKLGYENVYKAEWLYGLVTQMLVKGTPTQYPFDPLGVLSPDRKVWLELQKEWLKPLEPKSDEPKLSS